MIRDRLRHTDIDDGRTTAVWQLDAASAARIVRLEVRDDSGSVQTIEFAAHPDLSTARELYPEHTDLWNAVRDARAVAVLDTREVPAWTDERA